MYSRLICNHSNWKKLQIFQLVKTSHNILNMEYHSAIKTNEYAQPREMKSEPSISKKQTQSYNVAFMMSWKRENNRYR